MSPGSARVTIKVKFYFCVVKKPYFSQEWNNVSLGGGTEDAFVMYETGTGKKEFKLSWRFRSQDYGCHIKYTLVHKGTDTDVIAEGNYPEISLSDGTYTGSVTLVLNYPTTKYREDFEQKDPEFEIIAQGH